MARPHFWLLLFVSAIGAAEPTIELVGESPDGIEVVARFDEPAMTRVRRRDGRFLELTMEGLVNDGEPGAPSLPRISRIIAVPPGMQAEIAEIEMESENLAAPWPIAYAGAPRRHCGRGAGTRDHANIRRDHKAYSRPAPAPAVLSETSYLGPVAVALLTLSPIERDGNFAVAWANRIRVKVRFTGPRDMAPGPVDSAALDAASQPMLASLVLNPETLPAARAEELPRVDFFITLKRYESTLNELLKFKTDSGRQVRVHAFNSKPTTEQVKALIEQAYASSAPPAHTILVGSVEEIPSYRRSDYWTDYPYALLDAGDFPDLSIARFPVQSTAELKASIAKVIAREKEPRDNGAVLVTSGYETNWCHLNLKFIMEKIFAGSAYPLTVTKLYASEGAGTASVIQAYNANPNFIVYDGHGNAKGMTEIPVLIQHLSQLKNTAYPILFDIACLNSYWPSTGALPRNFADSIHPLEKAGVAGILAASSNSGGHDLFRHIFRASIYDEESASDPFHGINEVGSAILYGKVKYLEQFNGAGVALTDNNLFYYHGDPASTIFAGP